MTQERAKDEAERQAGQHWSELLRQRPGDCAHDVEAPRRLRRRGLGTLDRRFSGLRRGTAGSLCRSMAVRRGGFTYSLCQAGGELIGELARDVGHDAPAELRLLAAYLQRGADRHVRAGFLFGHQLLDEPTAGLDPVSARRLVTELSRITEGVTAIIATHDPLAMILGKRTIELRHGRIRCPADELRRPGKRHGAKGPSAAQVSAG